jgi:hypothetical protein
LKINICSSSLCLLCHDNTKYTIYFLLLSVRFIKKYYLELDGLPKALTKTDFFQRKPNLLRMVCCGLFFPAITTCNAVAVTVATTTKRCPLPLQRQSGQDVIGVGGVAHADHQWDGVGVQGDAQDGGQAALVEALQRDRAQPVGRGREHEVLGREGGVQRGPGVVGGADDGRGLERGHQVHGQRAQLVGHPACAQAHGDLGWQAAQVHLAGSVAPL